MSDMAIDRVRQFDAILKTMPQVDIETSHVIHAGMYSRTIMIPAGTILTGVLIKIATIVIISGDVTAYIDGKPVEFHGYNILAASAKRKQAFLAHTDTHVTMIFPSSAVSIDEAEEQFTDEFDLLMSHHCDNKINITGE